MKKTALLLSLMMILSLLAAPALAESSVLDESDLTELNEVLSINSESHNPEYRVTFDKNDLSVTEGLDEDWWNILLMGVDNYGTAQIYGRSDALMILSLNTKTGESKLSSIVRDLYVDLPVSGWKDRINTAYVYGGPYYAMKTVNEIFGLNITKYATVNLTGFVKIVDMMGGVDLVISVGEGVEVSYSSKEFVRGGGEDPVHLSGAQAIQYARLRKIDNNFGRNERQRKFLTAMLQKIRELDLGQVFGVAEEVLKNMETNLSAADLINLVFDVLPKYSELQTYSCPQEGEYKFTTLQSGASVVEAVDMDQMVDNLLKFIYGE